MKPGNDGTQLFSLADSLDCVLPFASNRLVPDAARADLRRLAGRLPPIVRGLLECRLDGRSHVDLSIGVLDTVHERALLRGCFALLDDGSPGWRQVMAFLEQWAGGTAATDTDRYVWFEFDLDDGAGGFPAPSVFLSMRDHARLPGWQAALACLSGRAPAIADRWLGNVPEAACVDFVGVMVPRAQGDLRINLSGLSPETAWVWLNENGAVLPERDRGVFTTLFDLGNPVLAVEAGMDQLGPRVGLECRPVSLSAAEQILDICRTRELCGSDALSMSMNWRGHTTVFDARNAFPAHLILEALSRPDEGPAVLVRKVNHLKVTFTASGPEAAKIYLAFSSGFDRSSSAF